MRNINYFISHVTFHRDQGEDVSFDDVIYVDLDIISSLSHTFSKKIPEGLYTGVSFTLGFNPVDNQQVKFDSGAETYMYWPDNLGGGQHFMKIEGTRIENGKPHLFNLHTGGLDGEDYSINYTLPVLESYVVKDTHDVMIKMDVMNWSQDPEIFDFKYFGPEIKGNHEGQSALKKNGFNALTAHLLK